MGPLLGCERCSWDTRATTSTPAPTTTRSPLPSGSSATSLPVCTSIYDPTLRLFVNNTGQLTVTNLIATLSLQRTVIAYRFTPEGTGGQWRIDDVYVDPRMR